VASTDLFVANYGGSVTELSTSTGALVRVISGSSYKFDDPDAMVLAGSDLFVANRSGNSVTELRASTGALVRVISGSSYDFNDPYAIAAADSYLFVANYDGNSVTAFES
jgi:hypothetical protein